MTDAQWLLAVVFLIYLSDCLVWLPKDSIAVVLPLRRGAGVIRVPSAWAGNAWGSLAFTSFLPPRAVFIADLSRDGQCRSLDIQENIDRVLAETRSLRLCARSVFVAVFVVVPAAGTLLGFSRIGLFLIAAVLACNVVLATSFVRTHRRVNPDDRWTRWTHAVVIGIATPSGMRAADYVTRHALSDFDPLLLAATVAGRDNSILKKILRELAHPIPGDRRTARYESWSRMGLTHRDEIPVRQASALSYCPRCLTQYEIERPACSDCRIALRKF